MLLFVLLASMAIVASSAESGTSVQTKARKIRHQKAHGSENDAARDHARKVNKHIVSTLKESPYYKKAAAQHRAERVRHGLSPEIVPHVEYVRMRDGTELFTEYWDPRIDPLKQVPTVLVRSPYGILGTENMADLYLPFGYVAVEQNQRGTGASGGDFCFWMTSRFDGTDTFDWIVSQEWSNGQVFEIGASADGILSTMDMKLPQPHLFGQWLMITTSSPYDTLFQNRQAIRQALAKDWLAVIQSNRPKLPAGTYYNTALRNEGYSSHYTPPGFNCDGFFNWPNITVSGDDFKNVNFPAIHSGGWYDIFLAPQIRNYENYQHNSSVGALDQQQLVIGPRGHCFFETTVSFPDDRFAWLWSYERSLDIFKNQVDPKTRASMPKSPAETFYPGEAPREKITLYVMGPDSRYYGDEEGALKSVTGMYWSSIKAWPSSVPLTLYLGPNKQLVDSPPSRGSISYLYDPTNPTPTNGGNNLFLRCGPQNQTDNDMRPDNTYFDYSFSENTVLLGSVVVNLNVKSSAKDTDFVVRISDVYPDGKTSILLGDNIIRMRWRDSDVKEAPAMEPGKEYSVQLLMWQLCYVFNAGHSMRVAVTSSNYPRYSANPNNGELVYEGGPIFNATNTIVLGEASNVVVPTVSIEELPKYGILRKK